MNIFVEGVPGSGRTKLCECLQTLYPQLVTHNSSHYSPIELTNSNVLTAQEYELLLIKYPELAEGIKKNTLKNQNYFILYYKGIENPPLNFIHYCEQKNIFGGKHSKERFLELIKRAISSYDKDNFLFEKVLLENIIDELVLFHEVRLNELVDIFTDLASVMNFDYFIYYVDADNIAETIRETASLRVDERGNKIWADYLLKYFNKTKFSNTHPYKTIEDCIEYYRIRNVFEQIILMKAFPGHYKILRNKTYSKEDLMI